MAIIGNAYIAVNAITTNFQRDVDNSLNGITRSFSSSGQRSGTAFSSGLSRGSSSLSNFRKQARAANDAFFAMVTTGYALGPAISVAIGGISSLVSGFVALTAQVGAAIPSLIVLPSILSAVAQAALVAKAAFGGIGAALKQMTKTGGGGGGEAAEEAKRKRVENAEKNLARVLEANRESLARASRNLTDAEQKLTDARKEAAESLQQLNFDAEDAAISEKKAAIELEKARQTLARVQDLPPNSRARREAELAYAEADLNLRRAKDRNADLAKETAEANKKGVEGSEAVVQATRDVQDAIDDKARTERDALRAQTDAEEELLEAKKKLNEEDKSGGGDTSAFDKLSDAAKEFVKFLISLKPKLDEIRNAAQEALLPPLQIAIQNLADNLFPRLIPIVRETAAALGQAAIDFSMFVTEANNLNKLDTVARTNIDTVGKLGIIFGNLYDVFLSLLAAADPLIRRFTDWIVTLTSGWRETRNAKLATGELTDTFNKAGDVAAQLGRVFGNIGGALMNIGRAAAGPGSGGQMLLDMFENSTKKFDEFTQRLSDTGRLQEFFRNTAENAAKISSLFVDLAKFFLKLGENKAIGETADILRAEFVPALYGMLDILQSAAPYLAEFAGKFVSLLMKFTETGSIQAFFGVLSKGLDVLNAVFGDPMVQKILLFIAPVMGAIKALTLMSKVGRFVGKVLFGYFDKLFGIGMKVYGVLQTIGGFLGGGALAGAGVVAGIAAVAAALYLMWQNSEKFREAIKELVGTVWNTLKSAFDSIKKTLDDVFKAFGGTSGAAEGLSKIFKTLGDILGKYVVPIVKTYVVNAINTAAGAIKIFINLVAGIIKVFQGVWEFVQGIFALLKGDMTGVKEHFGKAFDAIKDAFTFAFRAIKEFFSIVWDAIVAAVRTGWLIIKPIFEAFLTVFKTAWDTIKTVFDTVWGGIETAIGKVYGFFSDVFGRVRDFVAGVLKGIVDGVKGLPGKFLEFVTDVVNGAKGIGKAILDGFVQGLGSILGGAVDFAKSVGDAVYGAIKRAWNNFIDGINALVPDEIDIPGPWNIPLPDNPFSFLKLKLAEGGIVYPQAGGVPALIAEAGRPERVEPLDPDGLSRRDKEMIKMLAGPTSGNGIVINIHPSKGMDEAELASMVSRQLAFQLRRGAA